jgi:tetratricopeptide (TPR) repeat protein
MKKILGLALFSLLATGSMAYAAYYDEDVPDDIGVECWAAHRTMEPKDLIDCHKDLANWYREKGDYKNLYDEIGNVGYYYDMNGDYKNAIKYTLEAIEGFKKIGDKHGEADGYRQLGYIYKEKGDKNKAKEYYMKAYKLYKSIGAESEAQKTLKEMANKRRY